MVKPKAMYQAELAIAHLRAADPVLAELIDRVGGFGLVVDREASLFRALLRSIVYQQLHGKAAASIFGRVCQTLEAHGGVVPGTLALVSDEALRAAGLSRGKLAALKDLAEKTLSGQVPTLEDSYQLSDDELIDRLTVVRGIGPWTVHMLLIFYLGRPDVLPTGDLAIRLAFKKLYRKRRDPRPELIMQHARRWQPYRSVASWYLWRSFDLPATSA